MSDNAYELLALAARYFFVGLMLLILLRAWRITIVDNRRAKKLRKLAPETGLSGELIVLEGGERAKNGMRYPVIREGMIGSSRKADIRIRHSSIKHIHAYFELTPAGLALRSHGNAFLSRGWAEPSTKMLLTDGETIEIGGVQLMLVLSGAEGSQLVEAPHLMRKSAGETPFDFEPEEVPEDDFAPQKSKLYNAGREPDFDVPRPARKKRTIDQPIQPRGNVRKQQKNRRDSADQSDEDLWL